MNYPLLTVNRDYALGTASLSQMRFLLDPENADNSTDYQWYLPITYSVVTDGLNDFDDTHPEAFLEPSSTLDVGIGLTDAPVVFNVQNTGYYRLKKLYQF